MPGVSLQGPGLSAAAPLAVGAGIVSGLVLGKSRWNRAGLDRRRGLELCRPAEGCAGLTCSDRLLRGNRITMSNLHRNSPIDDPACSPQPSSPVLVASALAATLGLLLGRLQASSRNVSVAI